MPRTTFLSRHMKGLHLFHQLVNPSLNHPDVTAWQQAGTRTQKKPTAFRRLPEAQKGPACFPNGLSRDYQVRFL